VLRTYLARIWPMAAAAGCHEPAGPPDLADSRWTSEGAGLLLGQNYRQMGADLLGDGTTAWL
jgi:hypothetical protein